ncbi:MAG TPA: NAD-dependent epimerase/dehydratase family protein [Bacteroidales bacterium]|nr:NAD-dependent epimerase/dehydratase family protein [Bacteroidales bacterium]
MQTIIGSGGAIGLPLAKELKKYTSDIRLVSRNPVKVNDTDELFPLDVSDLPGIKRAVSGSGVVYITIGFNYNLKVWQDTWPPFMRAVIDACMESNARLVFFDNIYLYDRQAVPFMTESSPVKPPSKKGEVRRQLHEMIMNDVEKGKLTALIARAADFYGPVLKNSLIGEMVVKNLTKNKKAQAFGDIDKVHTYTYTPDAAGATALLGNTADAFNQVWHLPTTKERLTQRQWIEMIASELDVKPGIQTVPVWMVRLLGLVVPVMREFPEMVYQYETDYIFDSSKFEKRFGINATDPKEGIREMIKGMPA